VAGQLFEGLGLAFNLPPFLLRRAREPLALPARGGLRTPFRPPMKTLLAFAPTSNPTLHPRGIKEYAV